jgi:hypothetical protein
MLKFFTRAVRHCHTLFEPLSVFISFIHTLRHLYTHLYYVLRIHHLSTEGSGFNPLLSHTHHFLISRLQYTPLPPCEGNPPHPRRYSSCALHMYMEKGQPLGSHLYICSNVYGFGFRLLALHYTTLHILKNDILLNGLASCWNVRLKSVVHRRNFVLTLPSGSSYWRSFLDIVTVLPPLWLSSSARPPSTDSVRYCLVLYITLPRLS